MALAITGNRTKWHRYNNQEAHVVEYVCGSYSIENDKHCKMYSMSPQIAKFMGPTWDPPGADRTQVDPEMAPWTLLSRSEEYMHSLLSCFILLSLFYMGNVDIISKIFMWFIYPYPSGVLHWYWSIGCPRTNEVALKDKDEIKGYPCTTKHKRGHASFPQFTL